MLNGKPELGDRVQKAISIVGVDEKKLTEWLGRPCGCGRRREKLNQLDRWARKIIKGKTDKACEYFKKMISK